MHEISHDQGDAMKGISFCQQMAVAWFEGRKSVTRRLINPQPIDGAEYGGMNVYGQAIFYPPDDKEDTDDSCLRKPPYHPGETVYIKETWRAWFPTDEYDQPITGKWHIRYKADNAERITDVDWDEGQHYATPFECGVDTEPAYWKSPRFMPEWASRGHIIIVDVRPERVQEITEEETIKEGLKPIADCGNVVFHRNKQNQYCTGREEFAELWSTLHPGSWERNDWVWRIELRRA